MKSMLTSYKSFVYKCYLGAVFIVTLLLFYIPICLFLTTTKQKKKAFRIFVFWSKLVCFMCFIRTSVHRESETPEGPVVFVANHTSYLDIVLMYLLFPKHPFLFLGKAELLKVPLIKTFFKKLHIPVYRKSGPLSHKAFEDADKALKEGWSVILFPEGGIRENQVPKLQAFKSGAFRLAQNNQLAIVPITFLNNFELFEDPSTKNSLAKPGTAKIIVHSTVSKKEVVELSVDTLKRNTFQTIENCLIENEVYQQNINPSEPIV